MTESIIIIIIIIIIIVDAGSDTGSIQCES